MDVKTLMQELQVLFSKFQELTQEGDIPSEKDTRRFAKIFEQYVALANDELTGECEDFLHLSEQLHYAVKKKLTQDVIMLVESLKDAQEYCHRLL